VAGVLAATEIGDYDHLGQLGLNRSNRPLNDSIGIVTARCDVVLIGWNTEEQHGLYAEHEEFVRRLKRFIECEPRDSGHRLDRPGVCGSFGDEERLDELLDVNAVLADERANDFGSAQAPRA
jgi:hypothetical protein